MLFISKLFYNSSFDGGLIAWIIGLPFIVMIMLTTKKSKIETLVRSQMKFHNGEQIQHHLRYVLELIDSQEHDQNSYMLLIGYAEKHKEICQEEDCFPKKKKKKKKKKTKNKNKKQKIKKTQKNTKTIRSNRKT
eukprot:TRINITY_DN29636_c0_g1_i1.p2 TRINITY_DN29636_c0_g1~~TRINITY_DN29636_c0_g1_i1.p2  ORF type:complete len:134 (+),score=26.00 TRINITY_DN29636_c0_g1_i1:124-525(+)